MRKPTVASSPLPETGPPPSVPLKGETGPPPSVLPQLRIERWGGEHALTEPVPVSGPGATLSLLISGARSEATDINSLRAQIGGRQASPSYCYPFRPDCKALGGVDEMESRNFLHVQVPVPPGLSPEEEIDLQLWVHGVPCPPIALHLCSPPPRPPHIYLWHNTRDGGLDVTLESLATGLILVVMFLPRQVQCDDLEVDWGNLSVRPGRVEYLASCNAHKVHVPALADNRRGPLEVRVRYRDLCSSPVAVEVL